MLEIVVVAAGIVIASAADPRESLIGATMFKIDTENRCTNKDIYVYTNIEIYVYTTLTR
ncbi:unnamed protein product [Brassica rapa]|uniref:Uncharacterized protein n=1 Tax=Brassica campestris TaxID=3711 RepID=A0A8D9HBF8_BRACM|nr:unnamed protein product [Brassica rapa]